MEKKASQSGTCFNFLLRYYLWYQASDSAALAHPSLHCLRDPNFISLVEVVTAVRIAHEKGLRIDDGAVDFARLLSNNFCGHDSPLVKTWFACLRAHVHAHVHARKNLHAHSGLSGNGKHSLKQYC